MIESSGRARLESALPWPQHRAANGTTPPAAASVLGRDDVRALDAATIATGTPALELMERAGAAIARELAGIGGLTAKMDSRRPRLLVLAGCGNNGGDGFVVARLLARTHWRCTVALCAGEPRAGGEAAVNLDLWRRSAGRVIDICAAREAIESAEPQFDLILDALLGTGLDRPVDAALADIIHRLNFRALRPRPPTVVAVDIPSGLCADSGLALGCAVRASATVALGAYKTGLFVGEGPDYAGRLLVADIGLLPPFEAGVSTAGLALDALSTAGSLAAPSPMAHKGSRGHVLVVAGSRGKSGAAVLCARAALRGGAGLVTVAVPQSQQAVVAASIAEVMTAALPEDEAGAFSEACADRLDALIEVADSIVFGPGAGTGPGAAALLRAILTKARCPVVLDADGLNLGCLLGRDERRRLSVARASQAMGPVVLTPHPGEMGRLVEASTAEVQASRLEYAAKFAKSEGCVVVLKGAGTIVTDGVRTAFNTSGNAGMAAAGMGDVLAGVVGALAARCPDIVDAACLAVYSHGVAGDFCAYGRAASTGAALRLGFEEDFDVARNVVGSRLLAGFLAGEVADAIPAALAGLCA